MKLSFTLAVAALASIVAAGGSPLSKLPTCAISCVNGAIPSKCGLLNFRCICTDQSFLSKMGCCVSSACNKADQEKTLQAAHQLCAQGGVHNLPTTVACTTGATSTTTSGAATPTGSSTATSTSASATTTTASSPTSSPTAKTGGAVRAQNKDASFVAAAGAAAAFAILV